MSNTTETTEIEDLIERFYKVAGEEWGHFTHSVTSFVDSVDWTEPFIIGLLSYHVVMFFIIVFTRKNNTLQGILFLTLLAIVYCAQYINDFCMENWSLFSKTNYFGTDGFFISMLMSAPILLNTFVILINFLLELGNTLVEVKTKQIKQQMRNKAASAKETKKAK